MVSSFIDYSLRYTTAGLKKIFITHLTRNYSKSLKGVNDYSYWDMANSTPQRSVRVRKINIIPAGFGFLACNIL